MVELTFIVSQRAKLHVAGWTWAVFTIVYLLFLRYLQHQSGIFWIYPRTSQKFARDPLWVFRRCDADQNNRGTL
jgi:O-antigen/teichoic acid export membrane protein